jgi:hypothetical protein
MNPTSRRQYAGGVHARQDIVMGAPLDPQRMRLPAHAKMNRYMGLQRIQQLRNERPDGTPFGR